MLDRSGALTVTLLAALVLAGASPGYAQTADSHPGALTYPATRTVDHVDVLHGVQVPDPYRWMEALSTPEIERWTRGQDKLTDRYLSEVPQRDAIRQRILEIDRHDQVGWGVIKRGERHFFLSRPAGRGEVVLEVQTSVEGRTTLFDPDRDMPGRDLRLAGHRPSRNGDRVALGLAPGQSFWLRVRLLDAASGKTAPEVLTGLYGPGVNAAWVGDDAFYYVRYDLPASGQELTARVENARVFFHRVGTPQSEDRLVFNPTAQPGAWLTVVVTPDDRFLLIAVATDGGTFTRMSQEIYAMRADDPITEPRRILADPVAGFAVFGNEGNRLLVLTSVAAPLGRIVAIDLEHPAPAEWEELVAETEDPIGWAARVGSRIVIGYTHDARPLINLHDLDGAHAGELDLPDIGSVSGFSGEPGSDEAFYVFNGLYTPSTVYQLDVSTGESEIFVAPQVRFDRDAFVIRQVFFESRDGTRVPMFVAHKRGLTLDGTNPAYMYAYGSGQWIAFPWYQPHVIAWMEMGGVYALPGIRGGGEYGESWYKGGIGRNKQNGIDDYIAAAEWLIENDYTGAERMVANGGSASGLLPAAAILQRPELFGAALIDIPVLDMLRFHKFGSGNTWLPEFGSPDDDADDFAALLAYSPYHNIEPGTCYPPALVTVGEKDELATPLHGYKFVAAMQAAQACDRPMLLNVVWGGGHNLTLGTTREQSAESQADQWSFLIRTLGMDRTEIEAALGPVTR